MKKLPIGIQNFKEIRSENYYYVDKTIFIKKLFDSGKYYFLSRPRRFGKSLFLDTLKEAFIGNKNLFYGLYLYDNWDWEKNYPVIKIDLSKTSTESEIHLEKSFFYIINSLAEEYQIDLKEEFIQFRFEELLKKIHKNYNKKIVILIDEYDKPILDVITNENLAKRNRNILKNFFEIIKSNDELIQFVFITGVSRFSKVSLFSGLNQLRDITLSEDFSTICGYTQYELENTFKDRLKDFDTNKIKQWYDGYNWLGENVYNPFDILLFFSEKIFRPYWFETATPTFLIQIFEKYHYFLPHLENLKVGDYLISNLDIDYIYPENLLFQTGYLTIKDFIYKNNKIYYILTYPNLEVKISLNDAFLQYLTPHPIPNIQIDIQEAFENNDFEKLYHTLYQFFSSIPYEWYRKNELDKYEGYYASVIYALLNDAGLNIIAEDNTNTGRIDLTIIYLNKIFLLEFKVIKNTTDKKALEQIKEKKYYKKYKDNYKDIFLIGIEFSKEERNIINFEWEKYKD